MSDIKKYLSSIGKKGGESGKGKSKLRGDSEYYSKIASKRKKTMYVCPNTKCDSPCFHREPHEKNSECSQEKTCPCCVRVKNEKV